MEKPRTVSTITPEKRAEHIARLKALVDYDPFEQFWGAMSPRDRQIYVWMAGLTRDMSYMPYSRFSDETKTKLHAAAKRISLWAKEGERALDEIAEVSRIDFGEASL